MADIAMVFHWPPSAFAEMSFAELMQWRDMARERYEAQNRYDD